VTILASENTSADQDIHRRFREGPQFNETFAQEVAERCGAVGGVSDGNRILSISAAAIYHMDERQPGRGFFRNYGVPPGIAGSQSGSRRPGGDEIFGGYADF
jgi:hypothetical protein